MQTQDVYESATQGEDDNWEYDIRPDGTAAITSYYGSESSVTIPSVINGRTVTAIKSLDGMSHGVSSTKPAVTKITIPKTVKEIGPNVDRDWSNPGYIESDYKKAQQARVNVFQDVGSEAAVNPRYDEYGDLYCDYGYFVPSLKSINVAKGNKKFKSVKGVLYDKKGKKLLAFPNAYKKKYTMPAKVKYVAPYAFYQASAKKVTTSAKLKKIGAYAFYGAELKSVVIRKGTKSIGKYAFAWTGSSDKKFKSVKIPGSVKSIGERAFYGSNISKVSIGSGVKTIGQSAFARTNLKKVKIPGTVKTVKMFAFSDDPFIKKITIANGVKTIGIGAFEGTSVSKITFPASVKKIATSGKDTTKYLNGGSDTTRYIGNPFVTASKTNGVYADGSAYPSDPEADTYDFYMGAYRYDKNRAKKGNVKEAYASSLKLKSIKVAKGNKKYAAKGGVLFNKKMTTLIAYPFAKKGSSYKVPKKVKTIAAAAFACNQKLSTVNFSKAKKLKSFGQYSFANTSLSALTVPAKVKSVGYGAFCSRYLPVLETHTDSDGDTWTSWKWRDDADKPLTLNVPASTAAALGWQITAEYGYTSWDNDYKLGMYGYINPVLI